MSNVFSTKNITRIAVFSALAVVLYLWVKFPLPFMFPSWLDIQISEMPALLAGYMMGPVAGSIVIIVKFLIKLPFSSSGYVGEIGDLIIGLTFVIVSSVIYMRHRSLKGAVVSLIAGSISCSIVSLFTNAFILIPFFANQFGGMEAVAGAVSGLFPNVTADNFMLYYLPLSVLPFNLLRCIISSVITFLLYKRLSKLFDILFPPQEKYLLIDGKKCILKSVVTKSERGTLKVGEKLGKNLVGGEIILLSGDLGAGKTVFTKGLAKGLGITDEILSPTFTLMNCYEGRLRLYHYDAYRLTSGDEAEERGLTEYFGVGDGVCVIEWPENISSAIYGDKIIRVSLVSTGENRREINIC